MPPIYELIVPLFCSCHHRCLLRRRRGRRGLRSPRCWTPLRCGRTPSSSSTPSSTWSSSTARRSGPGGSRGACIACPLELLDVPAWETNSHYCSGSSSSSSSPAPRSSSRWTLTHRLFVFAVFFSCVCAHEGILRHGISGEKPRTRRCPVCLESLLLLLSKRGGRRFCWFVDLCRIR